MEKEIFKMVKFNLKNDLFYFSLKECMYQR